MALIDGMLQELEHEAATTRRVLERVPDGQLAWRPHEKSSPRPSMSVTRPPASSMSNDPAA